MSQIAAVSHGSEVDPCCCGGNCGIDCRSRGGTAALVGWEEFADPSSPPKKYLKKTFSGFTEECSSFADSSCASSIGFERQVYSGECTFDPDTGLVSITTAKVENYSQSIPNNCTTVGDLVSEGGICDLPHPPWPTDSICLFSATLTPTLNQRIGKGECCDTLTSGWRVGGGTAAATLTEEDTEDDAIGRLLADLSWPADDEGWLVQGSDECGECCISRHGLRTGDGFSFAYQESQYRAHHLIPVGEFRTVAVQILRRAIGEVAWAEYATHEFTAEGTAAEKTITGVVAHNPANPSGTSIATIPGHGLNTQTPVEIVGSGSIAGLPAAATYYVRVIDADRVTFHTTANDAAQGINRIELGALAGTVSIEHGEWYSTPTDVPIQRGYETTVGTCTIEPYLA
jgi:hypothetical protein